MSLFESASLVVTPNGTKASKLYAIKPTDGSGDLTVTRATTATRVNASGLISSVANNVPRLDYTNSTCPSILVEPQRTNLVLRSEEFDNASWTKSGVTITANAFNSPSGTLTSDLVTPTISDASLRQSFLPTGVLQYNFSIWLRSSTGSNFSTTLRVWRDSPFQNISNVVINVTTEWQRFNFSFTTLNATTHTIAIGASSTLSTGENFYAWGAQLEAGSNATSYIPTIASTVTRNADVISKTGISSLIGQTEGTIYSEIRVNKLLGTASRYVFHLSDGTANNRIYMAFSGASSNILRARIFNGGTLQCSINTSTLTNTGTYKIALAYKNNDIVFYVNGVQIGTDTSATIPTCSRVDLGHNYANASQLNDGISNANIWKTRLTNAELAEITTL